MTRRTPGDASGQGRARLGVLISGRGSNLAALYESIQRGELAADLAVVICNRAEAPGLRWAADRGLRCSVLTRDDLPDRTRRQIAMQAILKAAEIDLVVLAGFDEVLLPSFVSAFNGRLINIHPSLLPAFGGSMHAVRAAFEHGVKVSGCTVHFVTNDVDAGPIILQRVVEVREVDTVETLAERILAEEHQALPIAVKLFVTGRLRLEGRRVRVI